MTYIKGYSLNPAAKTAHYKARNDGYLASWADPVEMSLIYDVRQILEAQTGERYDVDHIVPINSPYVCGLHCEANLEICRAAVNRSKRNKIWPHMHSRSETFSQRA